MKPGIYHGLTRSEYLAIPAFNQSTLKKWIEFGIVERCPAKFKHWLDTKNDNDSTAAQIEGQVLDCLLLDPDSFVDKFAAIPATAPKRPTSAQLKAEKPSPQSAAAVAWWKKFEAESGDRVQISAETLAACGRMAQALRKSRFRPEGGAVVEVEAILSTYQKTVIVAEMGGHLCKAEIDLFRPGAKFIFDIKKTRNASNTERTFGADAIKFGYHIQASFYMDIATAIGEPRSSFAFLMVEDSEPYPTNAVSMVTGDEVVAWGRKQYRAALDSLASHMECGKWPGYPPFESILFPQWARMEADAALNHG